MDLGQIQTQIEDGGETGISLTFSDNAVNAALIDALSTRFCRATLLSPAKDGASNAEKYSSWVKEAREKGADLLLAAASKVLLRFPETVFHLIGDGEERTELEEQARQLGLGDRVVFEGSLPHQKTIHRIATSDLFVLPCRIAANGDRDALPTVLLEAMAAGVPAISTPVNGVPEIIDQGRTGLLVPPDDAASLAAAIEQLLADASTRRRMGREARIQAERRFDLRTSTSRLQSLFESAIFEGTIQRDRPSAQVAAI